MCWSESEQGLKVQNLKGQDLKTYVKTRSLESDFEDSESEDDL
jgi:hypothetical protein